MIALIPIALAIYITWVNFRLAYVVRRVDLLKTRACLEVDKTVVRNLSIETLDDAIKRLEYLVKQHTFRQLSMASLKIWISLDKLYPKNLFDKEDWPEVIGDEQHANRTKNSPGSDQKNPN